MLRRGRHRFIRRRIRPMPPREPDSPLRDGDTVPFPGYDRAADILANEVTQEIPEVERSTWDTEATEPCSVVLPLPSRLVRPFIVDGWRP